MISRALLRPTRRVAIVLGVALHLGSAIVHADVPTTVDMTACNQEAREESRDRSASPTSKDQADAESARRGRQGTTSLPGATAVTQSEDPQIHGMDAQGATDAAYRAAYRVCMRKRGF
jgi:hypothetical protein